MLPEHDVKELTYAIKKVASAITAPVGMGHDAAGGAVDCLTEAVMGITAGLHAVASAISEVAEAIKERAEDGVDA